MSKVLVDRELLERAAKTLENEAMLCHIDRVGSLTEIYYGLNDAIAQPAEAEGVEVVAYGMPNSAPGKAPRMMMVAIEIPGDDQYGGQLWEPLVRLAALSAVTAERDMLRGTVEATYNEWLDKTEWVQKTAKAHELGKHRADVLKDRIDQLRAEVERLTDAAGKAIAWLDAEQNGSGVGINRRLKLCRDAENALRAAMAAKEA